MNVSVKGLTQKVSLFIYMLLCCFLLRQVQRPEPPGWRACSSPRWHPRTRSRSGDRNRPVDEPAPIRDGVREPALGPATGTARLVSLLQSEVASANPLSVRRPEPPGWRACSSPRWRPQTRSRSGDRNLPVGEPAPVRDGVREPALGPATGTARLASLLQSEMASANPLSVRRPEPPG